MHIEKKHIIPFKIMKNQKENQMKVFSVNEVNDFKRLCTVHQFKRRAINNNLFGVESLVIYLPEIFGATEKKLSNVARYTNSRRQVEPCMLTKTKAGLKVTFVKK